MPDAVPGFTPIRQMELETMGYAPLVDLNDGTTVFAKVNPGSAPFVEWPDRPTITAEDIGERLVAPDVYASMLAELDAEPDPTDPVELAEPAGIIQQRPDGAESET